MERRYGAAVGFVKLSCGVPLLALLLLLLLPLPERAVAQGLPP
jgi:hypothetical protein